MEPRRPASRPRVFVVGLEGFSLYYLPHAREIVSRFDPRAGQACAPLVPRDARESRNR